MRLCVIAVFSMILKSILSLSVKRLPSKLTKSLFRRCIQSGKDKLDQSSKIQLPNTDHRFSVAPMMDFTYDHQRYFHRLLSSKTVLYTEMITSELLAHNPEHQSLSSTFDIENPIVLQMGGSDPVRMREAARMASKLGYTEINLNAGCPSAKVAGAGCFGARLMENSELVGDILNALSDGSGYQSTLKCRIGVNDKDSYSDLSEFIYNVEKKSQVKHIIVHARKAILDANLTPEENRKIPPLKYEYVYNLVRDFPNLRFTLNGGVGSIDEVKEHIAKGVHGVMVGRAALNNPFSWRHIDSEIYGTPDPGLSRRAVLEKYAQYAGELEALRGKKCRSSLYKPIANIFHGVPNTKQFKITVDRLMRDHSKPVSAVIREALAVIDPITLDAV